MIHSTVKGTIEGTACEIEYTNDAGEVVGYWAYGSFDPNLPFQGGDEMSEPTKAAIKAARALGLVCDRAEIIDRETGLPGVLWALKVARDVLADPASMDDRFAVQTTIDAIDNALRKAGEL